MLQTAHFGHLGAGVGQALGAAVAQPGRQVYCIIGDGAMAFHMQEIETAVRCDLKPVFLVCCDRQWGMVKINQMIALQPVARHVRRPRSVPTAAAPSTPISARSSGIALADGDGRLRRARLAIRPSSKPALRRCLAEDRCAVIHVDVEPTAHLFAPGLQYFKDMHQEPAGE